MSKRKFQVLLSEDAWSALERLSHEANAEFKNGSISGSDVINELIMTAKLDVRGLQAKHTNIRKSLRLLASQKEIDIDSAIRNLMDIKSKMNRKVQRSGSTNEVSLG